MPPNEAKLSRIINDRDIWKNRAFYLSREFGYEGFRFSFLEGDNEVRNQQVRGHIEGLLPNSADRKDIREVLASLFPNVASAVGSMLGESRQQPKGHEQRLADPICFPRYFLGRLPAGLLSDGEVKSIIGGWNRAEGDVAALVEKDFQRYHERKQLEELMDRVKAFSKELNPPQGRLVAVGIAKFTARNKWEGDVPTADAVFSLPIAIASRSPETLFAIASELVEAGSLYFAADLVWWLRRNTIGPEQLASLKALMEKTEARFHQHFVVGDRDIFVECPRSFNFILYGWSTAWETRPRSDAVESYVIKTIEGRPSNLGRLLAVHAKSRDVFPDWFLRLGVIIQIEKVVELLDRFGDAAVQSDDEKSAAEVIRRAVEEGKEASQKNEKD